MTTFYVYGQAIGQGSKRHVGNGVMIESSKKLRPWRDALAYAAAEAHGGEMFTGPVKLRMSVCITRPASHHGAKGLNPKAPVWPYRRQGADADKLARAVCDALTGIVYRDDKQVVLLEVMLNYSERAYCQVTVEELT